jgi:hypothetical protein
LFHIPLHHDSARLSRMQHFLQLNALDALDKLLLIPVLPAHNSTNYKVSKYVRLTHNTCIMYIVIV